MKETGLPKFEIGLAVMIASFFGLFDFSIKFAVEKYHLNELWTGPFYIVLLIIGLFVIYSKDVLILYQINGEKIMKTERLTSEFISLLKSQKNKILWAFTFVLLIFLLGIIASLVQVLIKKDYESVLKIAEFVI